MDQVNSEDIFIVGIGASAGGLEAIRTLLKSAPRDAPAAYVVAQHMSPTQKSMLTQLIARETHLQTEELDDPVWPQRNHVYVGPPGANIIFEDGLLKLAPASKDPAAPKPSVDHFLRTLAEGMAERAIGIILSGTGSDGSAGVKAIREAGGITFAQDDKSAKYDGMPNSAIETGCIDLVLSPVEIGQRLETLSLTLPRLAEVMKEEADQAPLTEILQIVLAKTRVDFRDYKPTTILRRMERRMAALGILSQPEYATYIRTHEEEVDALFRDFLISVTRFFRDPDQYEALETVIADMVARTKGRALRIWVAGCATGEEAYSVAMLFTEAMGGLAAARERGLQIFATDIDQRALQTARTGRYPIGALADVPEKFIAPYFNTEDDFATVVPDLKSMILFSVHNVVQDPPFKDIDLVCCRNLLIYFGPVLQDRTFSNFHYSLRDDGLVFLGTADSSAVSPDLFSDFALGKKVLEKRVLDDVNYQKRSRHIPYAAPKVVPVAAAAVADRSPLRPDSSVNTMVKALAASLGEAAVLLTRDLGIVYIFGDLTPYVSLQEGRVGADLTHNVLIDPLAAEVRVLSSMVSEDSPMRRGFKRRLERREGLPVQLEMILLKHEDLREDLYLVVFTRVEEDIDADAAGPDDPGLETMQGLRDELTQTRDALTQTVERWETANEELRSSNEEMQSNNEELQSLNEELETSNEELQSTNEELVTVNEAYQIQADELNELNEELEAVLTQVDTPLIIFDLGLAVSKFSQSAAHLFRMGQSPGNPHISQLALPPGFPPLVKICDQALRLGQSVVEEFEAEGRLWHLACSPFANIRGELQGGTLFATTSEEGAALTRLLDQMPNHMSHITADGTILRMSRQAAERLGVTVEDAVGRNLFDDLLDDETGADARQSIEAFMASGEQSDQVTQRRTSRRNGSEVILELERQRVPGTPGQPDTILSSGLDITQRLAREADLKRLNTEMERLLEKMPALMMHHRRDGTILKLSARSAANLGVTVRDALGRNVRDFLSGECAEEDRRMVDALLDGDETSVESTQNVTFQTSGRMITRRATHIRIPGGDGQEDTVLMTGEDVTDLQQREAELEQLNAEQQALLELLPCLMIHRKADGTILRLSHLAAEDLGVAPDQAAGKNLYDFLSPDSAEVSRAHLQAFLDSGEVHEETLRHRTLKATGEESILNAQWARMPATPDGEETVLQTGVDITRQVRHETALARANAELQLVLAHAPFYILHRDRAGRILRVSDAYCALMGHDPADMVGKEVHDFFVQEEADAVMVGGRALLDGDVKADRARMEITVKGGETRLMDVARFVIPAATDGGESTVCSIAMEAADPARQPAGATPQAQEG